MRTEHVLLSLTGLLLGCLITLGGVLLFFTGYSPTLTHWISHINLSALGLSMLFFGLFFLTMYAFFTRRRYLRVEMGSIDIDQEIFREMIKDRLTHLFPSQKIDCEVMIRRKGKLEIFANIPFSPEKEQLERIESDLAAGLAKCGYYRPFVLNVQIS